MKEKSRLSRLTAITTILQSKKIVTAPMLATKFSVSVRTIYRDIRTLEESGIPIVTEEGKGYSIMNGYHLPPVMFSESEANALITIEKLILNNKDASLIEQYNNAITKIKSVLKKSQKEKAELLSDRLFIRTNSKLKNDTTSNLLIKIQSTITNFRLLKIEYNSLDNVITERIIEPFAIYSTNGNWLLLAFCRLRNEFRAFRIDLIQRLISLNDTFEPHKITLEEYFRECQKKYSTTPDIPLSFTTPNFDSNQKLKFMESKKLNAFNIIGISVRTNNNNGKAAKDIPNLWEKFMSEGIFDKIPNKADSDIYAVYTDYVGDHTMDYTTIIGCKVNSLNDIPSNLVGKHIPESNYSRTNVSGNLKDGNIVIEAWQKIWNSNLDRKYSADFEIYGEKSQDFENAELEIYVAIN